MKRDQVDTLYTRHGRAVYRRARELLGDNEAANDVAQEVFIRVIRTGRPIPLEPTPSAWLYRITTNLCLNRMRDGNRRATLLSERYPAVGNVQPTAEVRVIVASMLCDLPPDVQEVVVYFFVDELSYDEIARLTGLSRRTVGNRLATFRQVAHRLVGQEPAPASVRVSFPLPPATGPGVLKMHDELLCAGHPSHDKAGGARPGR